MSDVNVFFRDWKCANKRITLTYACADDWERCDENRTCVADEQ